MIRDCRISFAKCSEKITFLPPDTLTYVHVSIRGLIRNVNISENSANILNE